MGGRTNKSECGQDRDVSARSYSILSQKQLPPHALSCSLQLSVGHISAINDRTRAALLPQTIAFLPWS